MANKEFDVDDDFNFDEFDDFENLDVEEPKDDRSPVRRVADAAISGAKRTITGEAFIKNFVRAALPQGYSDALQLGSEIKTEAGNLYNEVSSKIKPGLRDLGRATRTVLPKYESSLPKALVDRLKKVTDGIEDETRLPSKQQLQDESVKNELSSIFEVQMEQNQILSERERIEEAVVDRKRDRQHDSVVSVLQDLRDLTNRQVGYQDQIRSRWERKSLELQFNQLFVTRDLFDTVRTSNKSIIENLASITKNTALPEYVKQNMSEETRRYMRDKMVGRVGETFSDYSKNFLANFSKKVLDKGSEMATRFGGALTTAAQGIETLSDATSAENGGGGFGGFAADQGGEFIGSKVANHLGTLLGKKLRGYTDQHEGVNKLSSKLSYGVRNFPGLIDRFAKSDTDWGKRGAGALFALKQALPTYVGSGAQVTNGLASSSFQATPYGEQDRKSLTEIIPGFLSRILQSTEGIRTKGKVEREVYNYDRNEFTSYSQTRDDIANKIASPLQMESMDRDLNTLSKKLIGDKKLSPSAQKALKERLLKHMTTEGVFAPEDYAKSTHWGGDIPEDVRSELTSLFRDRYAVNGEGKIGDDSGALQRRIEDDEVFRMVREGIPNANKLVNLYANTGQREFLRDLGLLQKRRTDDIVNGSYLYDRYTGTNTSAGVKSESERRPESGDAGRLDGIVSPRPVGRDGTPTPLPSPTLPGTGVSPGNSSRGVVVDESLGDRLIDNLDENTRQIVEAITSTSVRTSVEDTNKLVLRVIEQLESGFNKSSGGAPTSPGYKRSLGGALGWLADKSVGATWGGLKMAGKLGLWNAKQMWDGGKLAGKLGWGTAKVAGTVAGWGLGAAGRVAMSPFHGVSDFVRNTFSPTKALIADAYILGRPSPVIEAKLLSDGFYHDQETGRVIETLADITGPVVDKDGNVLVSEADLKEGLRDARGNKLNLGKLRRQVDRSKKPISGFFKRKAAWVLNTDFNKICDVYLKDEPNPVLTAAKMRAGVYRDARSGKVIQSVGDIRGSVIDDKGGVIITDIDVRAGLFDAKGKKLNRSTGSKMVGGLMGLAKGALGIYLSPLKFGYGVVKSSVGFIRTPMDVYVKGERTPRLLARLMRNGQYISGSSGKVIKTYRDIDGPVMDLKGNELLSVEDISKGLVDRFGAPLKGLVGKAVSLAMKMITTPAKLAWRLAKASGRAAMATGGAALRVAGGIASGLGVMGRRALGIETADGSGSSKKVVSLLKSIRKILLERLPKPKGGVRFDKDGDGDRDNSWQDILSRKKKIAPGTTDPASGEPAPEEKSWLGSLLAAALGGITGLVGKLKEWLNPMEWVRKLMGSKGGDLLDDAGDMAEDYLDGTGDDSEDKRKRKGRRGRGSRRTRTPKPRGKFGKALDYGKKAWDYTRNSRVGQYGSKALNWAKNSKAGQYGSKALNWAKNSNTLRGGLQWGSRLLGLGAEGGAAEGAAMTAGRFVATNLARTALISAGGTMVAGAGGITIGAGGLALLGVAAVAAVGYGAYKGYQWYKARAGDLTELRMMQYGFPGDGDQVGDLRDLESELEEYTTVDKTGKANLRTDELDWEDLMEEFDVETSNPEQVATWMKWFRDRFTPVYLKHQSVLKSFSTELTLERVDRLDDLVKAKFAKSTLQMGANGPYSTMASPYPTIPITVTAEAIQAKVDAIATKYPVKGKDVAKSSEVSSKGIYSAAAVMPGQSKTKVVNPKATAATMSGVSFLTNTELEGKKRKAMKLSGGRDVWVEGQQNTIDDLTGVRMRAYGLSRLTIEDVNTLIALEKELKESVNFGWFGGVGLEIDPVSVFEKWAPNFNCDPSNEQNRTLWLYWFVNRFTPVYLNYAMALKKLGKYSGFESAWKTLKPDELYKVAKIVVESVVEINDTEVPVWQVAASPFADQEPNTDSGTVKAAMDGLKLKANQPLMSETVVDPKTGKTTIKQGSTNFGNYNNQSSGLASTSSYQSATGYGVGASGYGGYKGGINYGGGSVGGDSFDGGRQVVHPGAGTGGDINSLPVPTGDGWERCKELILATAKMVGVDPALLATMGSIESNYKVSAKAGTSSASGLFQFIDETWKEMLGRYGAKYGIAPGTPPTDPRANALMGAEFIKENSEYLQNKLGRQPTDTDLYAAHFLGKGGAVQLLGAAPGAVAAQLMPEPAAANRNIFYDKASGYTPRTVAGVYNYLNSLVSKHGSTVGMAASQMAATGKAPEVEVPTTTGAAFTGSSSVTSPAGGPGVEQEAENKTSANKPTFTNPSSFAAGQEPAAGHTRAEQTLVMPTSENSNSTSPLLKSTTPPLLEKPVADSKAVAQDKALESTQRTAAAKARIQEQQQLKAAAEARKQAVAMNEISTSLLEVNRSMDTTLKQILDGVKALKTAGANAGVAVSESTKTASKSSSKSLATTSGKIPVSMAVK